MAEKMNNKIKNFLNLIRVRQYYKNVLIFLGIILSGNIFSFQFYPGLLTGFLLLCLTSSLNYIINDIRDIEEDKQHPEKLKKKPLASGEISLRAAYGLLILFVIIIIGSLLFLVPNPIFALYLGIMFITGQLYTHIFKHYAFLDILTLALGYIWRTLAGCILINQPYVSAWLILAIYEVALFLVIAKRKGDLIAMGSKENAIKHKKIYNSYSKNLLDQFHVITAGAIFITYSIYLIFKFDLDFNNISEINFHFFEYLSIITIPIVLYILMRYMYLTSAKPEIARNPEKAFFDKGILVGGLLFGLILLNAFYYNEIYAILEVFFNIFFN
ncbi:MAG: hypothetical protein EU541_07390 [Promethearchaeota archaeon]|nr:MAG: hypothetical protein EU541_07390 [Candidatus Lokiarchaeota archaeon]